MQHSLQKKAGIILIYRPHILIIPECEHPEKIVFKEDLPKPTDIFWFGKNQYKGLAVFSFGDLKIKLLDHNPDFRFILPLRIYNDNLSWTVFAIWAQKPAHHDGYAEQVWNAVHFYVDLLHDDNVILAGDFNSNSIWDKPRRVYNHSNLVEVLKAKNIFSTYHYFHKQTQGAEKDRTLFMHRKADRPYHIDYCFASKNLINRVKNVEVGTYDVWAKYSDHNPLIVDFDMN